MNKLIEEDNEKASISLIMGKTKEPVVIPILPVTKEIIEKYNDDPEDDISKYHRNKIGMVGTLNYFENVLIVF